MGTGMACSRAVTFHAPAELFARLLQAQRKQMRSVEQIVLSVLEPAFEAADRAAVKR